MKHVMLDLETLGVSPGCMIVAIGAVEFDPRSNRMGGEFYTAVQWERPDYNYGLRIEEQTRAWWGKQSLEAQAVLKDPEALPLGPALGEFRDWFFGLGDVAGTLVWGNGADFDVPILRACYRATALANPLADPLGAFNARCYRTIKELAASKATKIVRTGTHHNALVDAKCQAQHLMDIVRAGTITLG